MEAAKILINASLIHASAGPIPTQTWMFTASASVGMNAQCMT